MTERIDYTPTTSEVLAEYCSTRSYPGESALGRALQFYRWLARERAQAKADALWEAADRLAASQYVGDWLRDQAEQVEKGQGL